MTARNPQREIQLAKRSSTHKTAPHKNPFRFTPLLAALLLVYPAMQVQRAQAEEVGGNTLPELGSQGEPGGSLMPTSHGVTLDRRFDGKHLVISPEYSDQSGLSMGGAFAFPLGERAAAGLLVAAGSRKKELLLNTGFQMGDSQRLVLSLGQLRHAR